MFSDAAHCAGRWAQKSRQTGNRDCTARNMNQGTGDFNLISGFYVSACCGLEVYVEKGAMFPCCTAHITPAQWSLVRLPGDLSRAS